MIPKPLDFQDILSFEIHIKLLKSPSHVWWKNSTSPIFLKFLWEVGVGWDEVVLTKAMVLVIYTNNSLYSVHLQILEVWCNQSTIKDTKIYQRKKGCRNKVCWQWCVQCTLPIVNISKKPLVDGTSWWNYTWSVINMKCYSVIWRWTSISWKCVL